MKLNIKINPFLNIPIGYCDIFFPPSVRTFFTSRPCIVIKQYDAIKRNIAKNSMIELINIIIMSNVFIRLNSMLRFDIAIKNTISDCNILANLIKSISLHIT